jgi:hypothetical protein
MQPLKVPSQTALLIACSKRALASEIFAPNFSLSAVHFLHSFDFLTSSQKCERFSQRKTLHHDSEQRSCRCRGSADVLLNPTSVKRITTSSSCNSLGITNRSIKCSGCTELDENKLNCRVKTASNESVYYTCKKP